jgi:hypothetical protein
MTLWRHNICLTCWCKLHSDREPIIVPNDEWLHQYICCFCGKLHQTGIYVRHNGEELRCKGKCE